jgi:NDP-sugar pyrophosphorylase family protein
MILAAGRGTRLGQLGRQIPKALVDVGGRPLLARQLDYLAAEGAMRIVINAHHLAEQIVEFVAAWPRPTGVEVEVNVEPELLGTAGGVRAALTRFDPSEPLVVIHADTIVHAPLSALVSSHVSASADATIAVNWLDDTHGKGVVELDNDGRIVSFIEKPADARPGLANAGVYVVQPKLIELVPEGSFCDFALELFPAALAVGLHLCGQAIDALAHDVGTPESLAHAQRRFAA